MELPNLANICLSHYGGWLVGSTAEILYRQREGEVFNPTVVTKDYDIIIPPIWFNQFLQIVPHYEFRGFKTLGGLGLKDEGIDYDIWSMDLHQYYHTLPEKYSGYAMNLNNEFIKRL